MIELSGAVHEPFFLGSLLILEQIEIILAHVSLNRGLAMNKINIWGGILRRIEIVIMRGRSPSRHRSERKM